MSIVRLRSRREVEDAVAKLDIETKNYAKMLGGAPYIQAISYKPGILRNTALASKHGNPTRELPRKVKEMIASSISMLNGCKYCITSHTGLLKGVYNVSDEELVELAAVVGHINGLNFLEKTAESNLFQLKDIQGDEMEEEVRGEYGEFPKFLKLASHDRELLTILWNREKVTIQEGKIERWIKELIALCVSLSNSCYENARIRLKILNNLEVKPESVFEALWVSERFSKNTKITEGLLLENSPDELLVIKDRKDQL